MRLKIFLNLLLAELWIIGVCSYIPTESKFDVQKRSNVNKRTDDTEISLNPDKAWMSSTYEEDSSAELAIKSNCNAMIRGWTSATKIERNPFWAIDLDGMYNVNRVVVTAMNDNEGVKRFKNVFVFVTVRKPKLDNKRIHFFLICPYFKGPAKQHEEVAFQCNKNGKYVAIVLRHSHESLKLCHIAVYGTVYGTEMKLVNGQWNTWQAWSSCSDTCGKGMTKRKRICDNPKPEFGGFDCEGADTDTKSCEIKCSNWSPWSTIGECSLPCLEGGGVQNKTRQCSLCPKSYHYAVQLCDCDLEMMANSKRNSLVLLVTSLVSGLIVTACILTALYVTKKEAISNFFNRRVKNINRNPTKTTNSQHGPLAE